MESYAQHFLSKSLTTNNSAVQCMVLKATYLTIFTLLCSGADGPIRGPVHGAELCAEDEQPGALVVPPEAALVRQHHSVVGKSPGVPLGGPRLLRPRPSVQVHC